MQKIYLDISNKGVVHTIHAKQGDVGRKFGVVLTDSGLPYIPTSGSAFSVWYSGASGEGNYTDIGEKSAFSVNENEVTVEMIAQMLSNEGEGILSLVLNDNGGNQIGLWSIRYVCESVPGANSEEAKEYYSAFSESVKKLSDTDAILRSKLSVDGTNTMEANLPMGNHRVTDLAAPVADGDAVNLAYAKKVGNPHNLLDNSDFRNTVNQRGSTSWKAVGYTIDRWDLANTGDSGIKLIGSGVEFATTSTLVLFRQVVPAEVRKRIVGKTVTAAAKTSDGRVWCSSCAISEVGAGVDGPQNEIDGLKINIYAAPTDNTLTVRLFSDSIATPVTIEWMALYEGEYTEETLPEYQPKGYGAELAECQRYYLKPVRNPLGYGYIYNSTAAIITIPLPIKMRTAPSITYDSLEIIYNGVSVSVSSPVIFELEGNAIRLNIPGEYATVGVPAILRASGFVFNADL